MNKITIFALSLASLLILASCGERDVSDMVLTSTKAVITTTTTTAVSMTSFLQSATTTTTTSETTTAETTISPDKLKPFVLDLTDDPVHPVFPEEDCLSDEQANALKRAIAWDLFDRSGWWYQYVLPDHIIKEGHFATGISYDSFMEFLHNTFTDDVIKSYLESGDPQSPLMYIDVGNELCIWSASEGSTDPHFGKAVGTLVSKTDTELEMAITVYIIADDGVWELVKSDLPYQSVKMKKVDGKWLIDQFELWL
jgi:hypothetical protein